MFKMPLPGKYHCNAKFIAGIDHFLIANAATGLDNVFYAIFVGCLNAVPKGKEGIGDKHRIFDGDSLFHAEPGHG